MGNLWANFYDCGQILMILTHFLEKIKVLKTQCLSGFTRFFGLLGIAGEEGFEPPQKVPIKPYFMRFLFRLWANSGQKFLKHEFDDST